MKRRSILSAASAIAGVLAAGSLAGCAVNPHRYFQPTADQIGPYPNSYGEAVIPRHGLIVVQGDDFAYGLSQGPSHHAINGAQAGQASITITQALRKVLKGVTIENRGFPRDTVAASAARWANLGPGNLLILSYGRGDMYAHTPVADFVNSLAAMIAAANAKGAAVFVVLPPPSADPLPNTQLNIYRVYAQAVANNAGVEVFDTAAAMARIKSTALKTDGQRAAVYQAIAADMMAYIKVVAAPSPQTGQAGSADSRTVRVSAASAS